MTIPAHLLFYFVVCMCCKYVPSSPIYYSFCLVFASLCVHASIRTHPHRYIPIYIHSHHFLPNSQKHDVRGNFPDHRVQILTCKTPYDPCLPCFCVRRAPCAPTHPSAPIYTHLHLFTPVNTLNFMYVCII